jgi:hypothetical protein
MTTYCDAKGRLRPAIVVLQHGIDDLGRVDLWVFPRPGEDGPADLSLPA